MTNPTRFDGGALGGSIVVNVMAPRKVGKIPFIMSINIEQGSQQRFPSSSHVVNKRKEAQIPWQVVL